LKNLSEILILGVALLHFYILWLEMLAWTTHGKKTFRSFPPELFEKTKSFAANQGLYNGFLGAGMIWSLLIKDPIWSVYVASFFPVCIIVAGIFGALTAQRSIFVVQSVPAIIALVCTLWR
jgi:putative membrane protein